MNEAIGAKTEEGLRRGRSRISCDFKLFFFFPFLTPRGRRLHASLFVIDVAFIFKFIHISASSTHFTIPCFSFNCTLLLPFDQ